MEENNNTSKIVLVAFNNGLTVPMSEDKYKDYLKNRQDYED